ALILAFGGFGVRMILRAVEVHAQEDVRRFSEVWSSVGANMSKIHDETVRRLEGDKEMLREQLRTKSEVMATQGRVLDTLAAITNHAVKNNNGNGGPA
ncbi:MAG: hypothetical protein NUV34_03135, partial [Sulfuricaulis sp.]|nr:hypothetical protein [Sulfuricaulis sp.]